VAGTVRLQRAGAVARLWLDSPGKLNAISVAMWRELGAHCAALAAEESVHCVVLRGAGGQFAAGADIEEFAQVRHDVDSGRRYQPVPMRAWGPRSDASAFRWRSPSWPPCCSG